MVIAALVVFAALLAAWLLAPADGRPAPTAREVGGPAAEPLPRAA